jgi:hypothetical protein
MDRNEMLSALGAFIRSRPGLEYGNYGDAKSYRAELRAIMRDKRDAETLLTQVALSSATAEDIIAASRNAFSGRLSFTHRGLEYCAGQYYPTEYRKAACAVLASVLWQRKSDSHAPGNGEKIRAEFRREYGRGIAGRWFQ